MADLKVGVEIGAKNAFSPEARRIGADADALSQRLAASQQKLDGLAARDKSIKRFRDLGKSVRQASAEFAAAKKKTEALKRELKAAETPSKKLEKALQSSKRETEELGRAQGRQRRELRDLRRELREAGIETGNLGRAQRDAAADLERTKGRMDAMRQAGDRVRNAEHAWGEGSQRMAGIMLGAGEVRQVGGRMRELGMRPVAAARPVAEQRGRLAQVGLDAEAIDLIQRRAWQVMRRMPGIASSDRFLGAAYDIKSGIGALDRQGVADFTEIAALAARASDSSVETQAKLFSQGYEVFRPSLPGMSDRQFAGAFGAMVTKAAQDFRTTGGEMSAAIKSMGPGPAKAGMSAGGQFALLSLFQQLGLSGSESGTLAKALTSSIAPRLGELRETYGINLVDETGNLLEPHQLATAVRQGFGEWGAETQGRIQQAFGSQEATEAWAVIYDAADRLEHASRAFGDVARDGEAYMRAVQAARDDSGHGDLEVFEQTLTAMAEEAGVRQVELLGGHIDKLSGVLNLLEAAPIGESATAMAAAGGLAELGADATIAGYGASMAWRGWEKWRANAEAKKAIAGPEGPRPGAWQRARAARQASPGRLARRGARPWLARTQGAGPSAQVLATLGLGRSARGCV